jgi:hypothetical protein
MQKGFREFVLGIYWMNRRVGGRSGYEPVRYLGYLLRNWGHGEEGRLAIGWRTCAVCLDSERTQVLLPCRHMCACDDCASWILGFDDEAKCPCCRSDVESSFKAYLS